MHHYFIVSFLLSLPLSFAREVQVGLQAPYPSRAVHPLVEVAEYLSERSQEDFWAFVSSLCDSQSSIELVDEAVTSKKEEHRRAMAQLAKGKAVEILPSGLQNVLEMSTNLGMYAPSVQFYETISPAGEMPCGVGNAFVVQYPGGIVSCDHEKEVPAAFNWSDSSSIVDNTVNMPWNHEYPFESKRKSTSMEQVEYNVLYGVIGSSSYCKLHYHLSSIAESGLKRYISRHSFPGVPELSSTRNIQGYGVFLDIKNMEYRHAADEKQSEANDVHDESDGAFSFNPEEEVEGVVFATLHERYPHLTKELKIAREELLEKSTDENTEMKMWKILDLGLQTTQTILSAANSDYVSSMNKILHNFPKYASSLSTVRVDDELKEAMTHLFRSGAASSIPNGLYVNGLRIDLSTATLNIFDVISEIRREIVDSEYLGQQGLSGEVKKRIIKHAASLTEGPQGASREAQMLEFVKSFKRVDVSKGGKYVIQFLNNLEKDSQYKRLPKSVHTLLQPAWQLIALRRNIYTIVAVVNPMTIEGASMLFQLSQIYEQQYPVRVGIVLACDGNSNGLATGVEAVANARDACQLFGFAKEKYGLKPAMSIVQKIASVIEEKAEDKFTPSYNAAQGSIATSSSASDIVVTKKQVLDIYAGKSIWLSPKVQHNVHALATLSNHKKQWTSMSEFYGEAENVLRESKGEEFVSNTTVYLEQRGLPSNSFSLNGMVQESSDVMSYLMQGLGREQQLLSVLVSMGKITDKSKSIFNSILKASSSFSRYHSLIEEINPDYVDTSSHDYLLLKSNLKYFNSHSLSQKLCGSDIDYSPSLYNTTVAAVPVHTKFGLQSLYSVVNWFLQRVSNNSDEASQTCGPLDVANENHRLAIVLRSPQGQIEMRHLRVLVVLSTILQSNEPESLFVLKRALESFINGTSIEETVEDLVKTFKTPAESNIVGSVDSVVREVGSYPAKMIRLLEGKSSLAAEVLQTSAFVNRVFESTDSNDVVLHYNARRLLVPFQKGVPLHSLDIEMLGDIEYPRMGSSLSEIVQSYEKLENGVHVPFTSDDMLFFASYCGRFAATGKSRLDVLGIMQDVGFAVDGHQGGGAISSNKFAFQVPGEDLYDDLSLILVIDPLTIAGQRGAAIAKLLQEQLQAPFTVILLPQLEISDFPLQNFYRFVSTTAEFTGDAVASFKKLPRQHTLTVRVDTPEAWNVQTLSAEQDIDNLKCSKYKCGDDDKAAHELTRVSYKLKNLAIAGQCYEGWSSGRPNPPNGLQLTLNRAMAPLDLARNVTGSAGGGNDADTLVMKNLGYYQLQGNPGLWKLGLAEGRAALLYTLDDAVRLGQDSVWIPVLSFTSSVHLLHVTKRPGMESLSLLDTDEKSDDEDANAGMWSTLSAQVQGLWGSGKEDKAVASSSDEDERIHIFSLATGQVYERLLRIMMLSAVKRTSVPIKFWLFEYYLSPKFKATVEAMCAEYNFEVGYVVYKWPDWLNQQTEKQRIIWGYKILFLDVLFPLNVKKVIYVDADQVVRADLKELWDMDLKGKPYAYTPFCDSRKETLGFQFWRQGYWEDHLHGKPYHISALYVVDLQVFRQKAVGDSLRAVYDQLSKDPNSLSNLDQDLPNYAQHVVPIHSLPQEWLWCESWCSDETKAQAKTIDLCNNPLYKEPKLDMAKRVISGDLFPESWIELDGEIKDVITKAGISVDY